MSLLLNAFCSVSTQTDDYGCINGCSSVYIDVLWNIQKRLNIQQIKREIIYDQNSEDTQGEDICNNLCFQEREDLKIVDDELSTTEERQCCGGEVALKSTVVNNTVNNSEECSRFEEVDEETFTERSVTEDNGHSVQNTDIASADNQNLRDSYKEIETILKELVQSKHQVAADVEKEYENRRVAVVTSVCSGSTIDETNYGCESVSRNCERDENMFVKSNTPVGVKPASISARQRIVDRFKLLRPKKSKQHLKNKKNTKQFDHKEQNSCRKKSNASDKASTGKQLDDVGVLASSSRLAREHRRISCSSRLKRKLNTRSKKNNVVVETQRKEIKEKKSISLKPDKQAIKARSLSKTRKKSCEKPKNYKCSVCEKAFAQKVHLDNHTRIHTNEKPWKCSYCGKGFITKSHRSIHLRIHTGEKPYQCSYCHKEFTQNGHLNDHIRIHTGEKPFKCPICCKAFTHKNTLRKHIRIHTSERPFKCSECGKLFKQKCHVKEHQRTHSGVKPYECQTCGKAFRQKSALNSHRRVHTGEKPFECSYCHKAFAHKNTLEHHLRTHTGEKPFVCTHCEKAFTYRDGLKYHLRTHTVK